MKIIRPEKRAVVTICIGRYSPMKDITVPFMEKYAHKIGADLIIIEEKVIDSKYPHFEKFQLFSILENYDRIIFLDSDIWVRENCENLFDVVPKDCIGMFDESTNPSYASIVKKEISNMQKHMGKVPWRDGFLGNTGLIVASKSHRKIFDIDKKNISQIWSKCFVPGAVYKDMSQINYNIQKLGYKTYSLPVKYQYHARSGNDSCWRDSRIIHFTGYTSARDYCDIVRYEIELYKEELKLIDENPFFERIFSEEIIPRDILEKFHTKSSTVTKAEIARLAECIINEKPKNIVELGSGWTTIAFANIVQKMNLSSRIFSFDESREYMDLYKRILDDRNLSSIASLNFAELKDWNGFWTYSKETIDNIIRDINGIDFLFIDGPSYSLHEGGHNPTGRESILPMLFDNINDGGLIIMHDAARAYEKEVVEKWKERYSNNIRISCCLDTGTWKGKGMVFIRKISPRNTVDNTIDWGLKWGDNLLSEISPSRRRTTQKKICSVVRKTRLHKENSSLRALRRAKRLKKLKRIRRIRLRSRRLKRLARIKR